MTCLAGADRSIRRTTMSAAKSTSASFMSSDGWRRSEPKPIQRDEPPGRHAEAGHQHGDEQAEGDDHQRDAELAPLPVVDAGEDQQRADADHHPQRLAEEDRPRASRR